MPNWYEAIGQQIHVMNAAVSFPWQPSPSVAFRPHAATGNKLARRLFSSLRYASGDSATSDRAVHRLLSSAPPPAALQTLSLLLSSPSPSASLALSIYRRLHSEPWFRWNANLAAGVASLLEASGRSADAEALISTSIADLSTRDADLFRCALIESYAKELLKSRVSEMYEGLMRDSSSPFVRRKACESAVKGLCSMGFPAEAEEVVAAMGVEGLGPSGFEFRVLAQAYGKLGLFEEMKRVLVAMENGGFELDTICSNVVISCYGDRGEIAEVLCWIKKMRSSGITTSIRTFNAALNSCRTFVSMLGELEGVPVSVDDAIGRLEEGCSADEAALVREMMTSKEVLGELGRWDSSCWKLDLHGCRPVSAFLILFLWLEELKRRFRVEKEAPSEVLIVCGSGRHSRVQGESPVRMLLSRVFFRMNSPLKMDRKNTGRFIAKGKVVKEWLSSRSC